MAGYPKGTRLHRPGIEPGPPAWQASILPLNQRCSHSNYALWGDRHQTKTLPTREVDDEDQHTCKAVLNPRVNELIWEHWPISSFHPFWPKFDVWTKSATLKATSSARYSSILKILDGTPAWVLQLVFHPPKGSSGGWENCCLDFLYWLLPAGFFVQELGQAVESSEKEMQKKNSFLHISWRPYIWQSFYSKAFKSIRRTLGQNVQCSVFVKRWTYLTSPSHESGEHWK